MKKTFYIIFRIRTTVGAKLKIARLEAENKRSANERCVSNDPEGARRVAYATARQ